MDFTRLSRNLYNEITSDEFTSDTSDDGDEDNDEDEDDDKDINTLNGSSYKKSTKKNLISTFHEECDIDDKKNRNIVLKLFQRERTGFMSGSFMNKKNRTAFNKVPSRLSFCLKNIVPYCFLQCHMFMGLTACGQFLVSYKVCYDENWAANINYNFNSYYKYTLYFWIYRPHQPLGKFFKTCLFDDHGVDNLKSVTMTQWNTNPRILIVHGASEHENEDSYITIVRVPKLGCLDCKKLMDAEGDGSFFRCDALCIKCNLTIHTKYSTTESDPKFNPYLNLISPERIIIVGNGFIHMLHVELEIQNQQQSYTSTTNQHIVGNFHQQQHQQFLNYFTRDTIIHNSQIQQKDDKTVSDIINHQLQSCDKKTQWLPSSNNTWSNSSNNSRSNINSTTITGASAVSTEIGCDNKDNIVARIIADFSEYENDSQNEKLSTFYTSDMNYKNKNYDELIFTCGLNTSACPSSSSINELNKQVTSNSPGSHSKVSLLNHSKSRRNHRIVTKSFRNGVTTVDLQGTNTIDSNNANASTDKASAYEFSEDNEKCEKIGIFRKRRLADKKYEFSEDNSENIVPFHKSRILSQSTRSRLHRALTSSHHHPVYVSASSSQTYETTTHHHRASPSQGFRSPCGSPVGSSRFLRSPSKTNPTNCSNMQQIQQLPSCSYQHQQQTQQQQSQQQTITAKPLNTLSPRQISAAIKTHFETPCNAGNMSPITPLLSPRRESPFENRVFEVSLSASNEGQEKPTCTKKLKRRYVEEDDATSVITSEEDDCIFPGYHTSLPMEVHGSCYSDMQMISQASYQKLKCPSVIITQHSFDLETFTYYVISNLCQKNNKTYDVFYDWACELVNVCPHNNSITCILMAHFTARDQLSNDSTKCLNCSRNIDCVFHRKQFECRILFTWNMEVGDWDVLDYGDLNEVPSYYKKSMIGLNKVAKNLASELSDNLNKIHNYTHNLRVLDSNIDKSKDSLTDLDNCIRFYRKKPKYSNCDALLLSDN